MIKVNVTRAFGNAGADPVLTYTPKGTPVSKFPVYVNKRYRDASGEQKEKTTRFQVTAWGKLAESVTKRVSSGTSLYIEGEVDLDEWTSEDGKNHARLALTLDGFRIVGGSRMAEEGSDASDIVDDEADAGTATTEQ